MSKMKVVKNPKTSSGLHCEVEGCIVNIKPGLTNAEGRTFTQVDITPDEGWRLVDGCRVVQD